MVNVHRQGDVVLFELEEAPRQSIEEMLTKVDGYYTAPWERGDGVLALGEATGHAHRLEGDFVHLKAKLGSGREIVFVGPGGALEVHEEHGAMQKLLPGRWYQKIQQQQYDGQTARRVRD